MAFDFVQHALLCSQNGLEVKLQAQGLEDCPLALTPQNTVAGTCGGFVPGQVQQLRLLYFARLPAPAQPEILELASATTLLDLTGFEGEEAVVNFDRIDHYPDDDGDGRPNLTEWCEATDPRGP
jgi:hypothetical protein